ncbi:Ionotropic receptor 93a [Pseudolycoriella hygida]|uniref:Ionotropic receptor 93a n=1 Tax=Pseudolycoriella hygida TaxID=35572 RepID=A0A9Q0MW14_9DIPT|nr:Ionotropic receptor 93a [Pseudolycoriella hygida]
MKQTIVILYAVTACLLYFDYGNANDFPSLLVANASMAVIVDHEFLDTEYDHVLSKIKYLVDQIIRDDLRDGVGINVRYYSWTQIRFNKDFTIVMSVSNCKDTWQIFHEVQVETLLLIALTEANCPRLPSNEAIMIPLIKIGDELPQILLDIRSSQIVNWKSAIIVYDNTFDRDSLSKVVNSLSSLTQKSDATVMSISLFRIDENESNYRANVRKTLGSIASKNAEEKYFAIASKPHVIMEEAEKLGLTDSFSQWLFFLRKNTASKNGTLPIMKFIKEGGNIAIGINSTHTNTECLSGILCHFEQSFKILVEALSKTIKKEAAIYGQISDEEWEAIRLTKRERRDGMMKIIRDHFSHKQVCSNCIKWDFIATETWGASYIDSSPNKTLQISRAATWEPTNGVLENDSLFPHISHGFRGKTFSIATYHNPPWQIIQYGENGKVISTKGVVLQILDELSEKLNFTYLLIDPMRNKNSTVVEDYANYNDTDLIGSNIVPILLGAVAATVDENYSSIVNYTRPITIQTYSFLVSRPKELSRLYLFTAPFTIDTWVCLTLTVVIIGPILFGIHYMSPYNDYNNIIKKGGLYKIGNCFWYIYGALLQQGGMYLPSSDSGRLIVGTWWLGVLVVVTTYCGNLVAFLTFPKIENPIANLHQLLHTAHDVTWSIKSKTFFEYYIKNSENNKYKALNDGAMYTNNATGEIIQSVKMGKHIYIDWKTNLKFIMKNDYLETNRCELGIGEEEFVDEKIALILPLNSPYHKLFDRELYRLLQMGFIQKWISEYLPKKDKCWSTGKSQDIENHTVNLTDMQGCFLVLLTGTLIAVVIVVIEFLVARYGDTLKDKTITAFVK